jgi:hypothetical protein
MTAEFINIIHPVSQKTFNSGNSSINFRLLNRVLQNWVPKDAWKQAFFFFENIAITNSDWITVIFLDDQTDFYLLATF